jgi:hypothetical protein
MKPKKPIESLILTLRGQKVMLDADLAELYGVPTKRLNEQVKRNADRFPEDFIFQLSAPELENLKSQFATSSLTVAKAEAVTPNWSQFATASHGGRRKLPFAFTEHGSIMAAMVLNSPEAVAMNFRFVKLCSMGGRQPVQKKIKKDIAFVFNRGIFFAPLRPNGR